MYERFTDRARKVMALANEEVRRFNHEYIGTEHILLGFVEEDSGNAPNVLKQLGLSLEKVRSAVEQLIIRGSDPVTMNTLVLTPRSKQVIMYAMEECRGLGHSVVRIEHLLLGLMRDEETVAVQILLNLGLRLEAARGDVLKLLEHSEIAPEPVQANTITKIVRQLFAKPNDHSSALAPRIATQAGAVASLVAVDIGNSGIKLGKFALDRRNAATKHVTEAEESLPEPVSTLELPIAHKTGLFELKLLAAWCGKHVSPDTQWSIASVHRGASELFGATIANWAKHSHVAWPTRQLTYQDVPLEIRVEEPARVGIDRLLAAVAANRLRAPDRAAIIVDLGTAITVDLLEADGGFAGGAILPGIGMAGRALAEQTDALPHVILEHQETPPTALGKSTKAAIEAGLYWGAVGAVGELISRLTASLTAQPDIFITGGAARTVVDTMEATARVQYVPHLVLSGIAIVDAQTRGKTGG